MKKIFILTGEPSGDKLASKVIKEFNSATQKFDAVKRCPSEGFKCERIAIERIKHFVSKKAFSIDGFAEKQISQLYDLGWIQSPVDIFFLKKKHGHTSDLSIKNIANWHLLRIYKFNYY